MARIRHYRALITGALTVVICAALVATASAYVFADHVEIAAGHWYAGPPSTSNVSAVSVQSYGSAYSGTWINSSSGRDTNQRVSADNYCNSPGCVVQIGWSGAKPSGYGTAENHGNASPSYFAGVIN